MTSAAKHTAGPVIASGRIRNVSGDQLWCVQVEPSAAISQYRGTIASIQSAAQIGGITNDEAEANAAFIAEAFNVAHETGLTTRQLADAYTALRNGSRVAVEAWKAERDELVAAAKALLMSDQIRDWDTSEAVTLRAAITKARQTAAQPANQAEAR